MTRKKSSKKSGSGPSNPEEYYAVMDGGGAKKPENPDVYSLKKTSRTEPLMPGDEGEGRDLPEEAE